MKRMKKIASCIAAVMMLAVMAGTACAWDFTDHVKVAPNGEGDALIYPFYAAANGGWESKIWVVNTARDRSVVAKLIVNSMVNTEELLDFLIYLSPSDVWNGIIRVSETGKVEMYSTDDSAFASVGVWASKNNPLQVTLKTPTCSDPNNPNYNYVDTNQLGYVEVIMSAHSIAGGMGDPDGAGGQLNAVSLNTPPVPKAAIFEAYWGAVVGLAGDTPQGATPTGPNMVPDGINVLAGHMEFRNLSINQNSVVPATALRDYDGALQAARGFNVGNRTVLGENNANNSIGEVEAALSKDKIALPVTSKNGTIHILTFPTKLTILGAATDPQRCGSSRRTDSPFFDRGINNANLMSIAVTKTDFDLSEHPSTSAGIFSPSTGKTLSAEVNAVYGFAYDEGWVEYDLDSALPVVTRFDTRSSNNPLQYDDGSYDGIPVIAAAVSLDDNGYWANGSAWRDTTVQNLKNANGTAAAVPYTYYYYQYWDSSNTGVLYDSDRPAAGSGAATIEDDARVDTSGVGAIDAHKPVRP